MPVYEIYEYNKVTNVRILWYKSCATLEEAMTFVNEKKRYLAEGYEIRIIKTIHQEELVYRVDNDELWEKIHEETEKIMKKGKKKNGKVG